MTGPPPTDPVLFGYTFATDPVRLEVSTAAAPTRGRVNIAVVPPPLQQNGQPAAYCDTLLLAVPVQGGAGPVFTPSVAGSVSTDRWSVASHVKTDADLVAAEPSAVYATFEFACPGAADYSVAYPLILGLIGTIASAPAESSLWIA